MTARNVSAASGTPLRQSLDAPDQPVYFYPQVPSIQHPPPARINYAKRFSEGQATDNTRVQSSVSSASGSSSFSYRKHQTPTPDLHWPSPTRERTLVNSDGQYPTQWHSSGSARAGHSHNKSEMTERPSPALAHIRERRQLEQENEEDEYEEDDHAIWILVRMAAIPHAITLC